MKCPNLKAERNNSSLKSVSTCSEAASCKGAVLLTAFTAS